MGRVIQGKSFCCHKLLNKLSLRKQILEQEILGNIRKISKLVGTQPNTQSSLKKLVLGSSGHNYGNQISKFSVIVHFFLIFSIMLNVLSRMQFNYYFLGNASLPLIYKRDASVKKSQQRKNANISKLFRNLCKSDGY